MNKIKFSQKEKAKCFDELAKHFYNSNFGQMSKSDIELLMFSFYLDKMICDNQKDDGTIEYNKCSDYRISKELGITQARVKNFKIKKQLIYPVEFHWEKALASLTKDARFDKSSNKITINIPDPNLFLEIQNFIEEQGSYVETQLNSKILQIRAEYYINLIIAIEDSEQNRDKIIKHVKKQLLISNKEEMLFDENNVGKTLISTTADIATIISSISSLVSPSNILFSALKTLVIK